MVARNRTRRSGLLLGALLFSAALAPRGRAAEALRVVTTIPDLADIAAAIGGERVTVQSLARGTENVHAVVVKPSSLVAVSRADVFVQVGLALEHAWVPGLLVAARNPRIQPGAAGFVTASDGLVPIQVPESASRKQGADLHLYGNPHVNLDPRAGAHFAEQIEAALVRALPEHAEELRARAAAYRGELAAAQERWSAWGAPLAGKRVATYHREFDYLLRSLDVELAVLIEPKPGVPPSPRDLAAAIETMRAKGVSVVVTAPWSNTSAVQNVAEKTGAKVVVLPTMVKGEPGVRTWIELIDRAHTGLLEGFGLPAPTK